MTSGTTLATEKVVGLLSMNMKRQHTILAATMPVTVHSRQDRVIYSSRLPRNSVPNVLNGPLPPRVPVCSVSASLPALKVMA